MATHILSYLDIIKSDRIFLINECYFLTRGSNHNNRDMYTARVHKYLSHVSILKIKTLACIKAVRYNKTCI